MRRYNTLYYLLIVLLIMGTFASMAQNGYGAHVIGFVSITFGVLFLLQLYQSFSLVPTVSVRLNQLEFLGLAALSIIMSFRVFFIHFDYVELLFVVGGCIVIIAYIIRLWRRLVDQKEKNIKLTLLIICYYLSIIIFLVSMVTVPFTPSLAEPFGVVGFGLLLLFFLLSLVFNPLVLMGENTTSFRLVTQLKDRSVLLLSLFFLFTVYMGLTKIEVLPKMYSDEFPQEYYELINHAEMGLEKPVDGVYKHERFKEYYDLFVTRHGKSTPTK